MDPTYKRRSAQLYGKEQGVVERDEYRNLQEHGETTAEGVHLMLFVKLQHFLVHFLAVILIPFLDDFDVGLNFLHPFHRLETFVREWCENDFNDEGHKDDCPAIVVKYFQ